MSTGMFGYQPYSKYSNYREKVPCQASDKANQLRKSPDFIFYPHFLLIFHWFQLDTMRGYIWLMLSTPVMILVTVFGQAEVKIPQFSKR